MKIPTQKGEHSANVQSCPYNEKRVLLYMHVAEDNWAVVKGCDSNVKVNCSNCEKSRIYCRFYLGAWVKIEVVIEYHVC